MAKINKSDLKEIWGMRHLSVKDFLEALSQHPTLKFLVTAAGLWWLTRFIIGIIIGVNVIYLVGRIFHLVLA